MKLHTSVSEFQWGEKIFGQQQQQERRNEI